MSWISSQGSGASVLDSSEPACGPSLSASETSGAGPSCASTGPTSPAMTTCDLFPESAGSASSVAGFRASPSASPGSSAARMMTATSGLQCLRSSGESGRLGLLSRTLMGSSDWHSTKRWLIWKPRATPGGRLYYQLVPSTPRTAGIDYSLLPTPSGTSSHGKNHVMGRLDEWGGSSNRWRGTETGKVRCASFEEWMMGFPTGWTELTPSEMPSSRKSSKKSAARS
jgi:hypothetical protein